MSDRTINESPYQHLWKLINAHVSAQRHPINGPDPHGDSVRQMLDDALRAALATLQGLSPATNGIATEDGIRWQAGAWGVERKAVTVDGRTWYRDDHEKVKAPQGLSPAQATLWVLTTSIGNPVPTVRTDPPHDISEHAWTPLFARAAIQAAPPRGEEPKP